MTYIGPAERAALIHGLRALADYLELNPGVPAPGCADVYAFISGSAFGALALFIISIHRAGRGSLFEATGRQRGAISRGVLVTTRAGREEDGQ
jgi:hypothetical protein